MKKIKISAYFGRKILWKIERDFLDPKKQAQFKAWKKKKDSQRSESTIELKIINHEVCKYDNKEN